MKAQQYIVMGVCGSGKTVIGSALAAALGVEFVEGDAFHPPDNVRKMAAGIPLTDDDRVGWLDSLSQRLRQAKRTDETIVMSCSALKRGYRDILRRGAPGLQLIWLHGPRELLQQRMATRKGHFMPVGLLDSQLATLEAPTPDEGAWEFDVSQPLEEIVDDLVAKVGV